MTVVTVTKTEEITVPDGTTHYRNRNGLFVYFKLEDSQWYRWTGENWKEYNQTPLYVAAV